MKNVKSIRVYELYPTMSGFSVKTSDYGGIVFAVAAVSIKQAYYYAYQKTWAQDTENPLGVLWIYDKWLLGSGYDTTCFNGSKGYGMGTPQRGDGKRIISKWMMKMTSKRD